MIIRFKDSNDALEKLISSEIKLYAVMILLRRSLEKCLISLRRLRLNRINKMITIKGSNIQLYNIVIDFIVNNYELYKEELGDLMRLLVSNDT